MYTDINIHFTLAGRLKMTKAFREGKVSLRLIKCVCQGSPRVGKTHIKYLLLGKVLVDSSSTGLAEHPELAFRNVSSEIVQEDASSTDGAKHQVHSFRSTTSEKYKVEESHKTWEIMDDEKLTLLMAKEMSELQIEKEEELGNDVVESRVSNTPVTGRIEEGGPAKTTIQEIKKSLMRRDLSQLPATGKQDWIYFIDSGGQPQFQEVLQAFIPNTSVLLLAIKLTEKLSNCPLMEYEKSGVKYSLGHHALSNQQILIRLAKMISSSESNMQIALAGTHYDEYVKTDTPSETMEEKEQQLQEIFSFCEDDLIFRDSVFQNIIFPVNGLQAEEGKFDDPIVCELRSSITSTPNPIKIDVPLRWHAFELAIQAEARRMGTQVLSLEKCIEISEALNFPRDDVIPALTFLSNYNLILYYPSLLPKVVFTTPQVLLDKVTELIERVYQLSNPENSVNQPHATQGEYNAMRDLGIMSTQILKDFPKHYIADLFTEDDMVKIFKYLYIFAEIENGKFFMPALLPPFTPVELDQLLNLSTPPLLFNFEDSCAPAGLFCALVVCLASHLTKWKVRHDIKPLNGVKSNAACFVIPGISLVATLVDSFYQFELHYRCFPQHEKHLPRIREVVSEGLEEVIHNRKFNTAIPKKAFFCRSSECIENRSTHRHVATPAIEDKELICSSDPLIYYEMNDVESKWLKPVPLPPSNSDTPTMDQLMTELEQVSSIWVRVGIHLLLPVWRIESIEKNNRGQCYECLMSVLEHWRNSANTKSPFSWETIIAVLRSKSIGNHRLADEIECKYVKK